MCKKLVYHKQQVKTGSYLNFITKDNNVIAGKWGMFSYKNEQPVQSLVRVEYLRNLWVQFLENRGILEIDGFFGEESFFRKKDGSQLRIPIIYDDNYDFALVTKEQRGIVKCENLRQPILLCEEKGHLWLESSKMLQLKDSDLIGETLNTKTDVDG